MSSKEESVTLSTEVVDAAVQSVNEELTAAVNEVVQDAVEKAVEQLEETKEEVVAAAAEQINLVEEVNAGNCVLCTIM